MAMKMVMRVLVLILVGLSIIPVAYIALKSFEGDQYRELFLNNHKFFKYALRTALMSAGSALAGVVIALPVGFLFAKVMFRFKNAIFFLYILVMLLPFQATQLPGYLLIKRMGLLDSPVSLVFMVCFSPLAVFLFRQCFITLPDELADAFSLESSSRLRFFRYIAVPFSWPVAVTLFVLLFSYGYGMVEQAFIYMPGNTEDYPLSAVLGQLPEEALYAGDFMYVLPVLLIFVVLEKYIDKGIRSYIWEA